MRLIEKIEISYFRSFGETAKIERCLDLNVISGGNDSGKSNILRALNLFFTEDRVDFYNFLNFNKDFSKQREKIVTSHQIKGKKVFKIRILFNRKKFSNAVLPNSFWIEKIWDKDGNVTRKTKQKNGSILRRKTTDKDAKDSKVESSTTSFLKKIHFFYVPAIKSQVFFDHLKGEYQKSLGNAIDKLSKVDKSNKKTLEEWVKILNTGDIRSLLDEKINSEAKKMLSEFKQSASEVTESFLSIPNLDFSKVLEIHTEQDIPLDHRGDGVQAKFIPHILDEISKNNRSQLVIWGFEEPENSYEYSNAQDLAEKFLEYSDEKQIFITSHSFNFVTLSGNNVSKYRVWKKDSSISNICLLPDNVQDLQTRLFDFDTNQEELYEELGIPLLSQELKELWDKKKNELKELEEIKKQVQKKFSDLEKLKPAKIFICEDEKAKKIWKHFFQEYGIEGIEIYSSNGCCNFEEEIAIKKIKEKDPNYNPRVFRQNDRDGFSDDEENIIKSYYQDKVYKGMNYSFFFLPVCEIENFLILDQDIEALGVNKCLDIAAQTRRTLEVNIDMYYKKNIDAKNINPNNGELRDKLMLKSEENKAKYWKGKAICQKIGISKTESKLLNLKGSDFPQELSDYLEKIKEFFYS